MTDLIVVEKIDLVPFFTKGEQVEDLLAQIELEALAFVPDVSSDKGRKAIKAMVTKVTKSKTYLESKGKELAAEYKAIPKVIDANRRAVKDKLTALAEQVREPLSVYEAEQLEIALEAKRVRDAEALALQVDQDHEFGLLLNKQLDAEAKELAEAEAKAETERALQAKADQEGRDKRIAEEAASEAKAIAEAAEKRAIEAEDRAAQQAVQAKIDAESAAERARLAEVARQDKIKADEAEALAKREANKRHIGAIRKSAKESIMALGISEDSAKKLVLAIHSGDIENVVINY